MRLTGSERRQAIIQAAIRLFSEKGFRGTTTREIASAVGVSEPVIYQHFATKKELYAAIIEAKILEASSQLDDVAKFDCSSDRAVFLGLGRLIWRWFEDDRTMIRLLYFSALEGIELADMFFNRHAADFLETVSSFIRKRIEERAFRPVNPETMAWAFIGMVAHHAESASVFGFDPNPGDREGALAETVDLFLRGILIKDHDANQTVPKLAKSTPRKRAGAGSGTGGGLREKG